MVCSHHFRAQVLHWFELLTNARAQDSVNRRVSMKMITDAARVANEKQHILITPLDIANLAHGPEVRISQMHDPGILFRSRSCTRFPNTALYRSQCWHAPFWRS